MKNIFYRKYNCSIEAPHFKGQSIITDTITSTGSIIQMTGSDPLDTGAHSITAKLFPMINYTTFCGTLDLYLTTLNGSKNHVIMCVLNKTLTTNTIITYQSIGNLTNPFAEINGKNYAVYTGDVTLLKWKFSGYGIL